MNFVYVVHQGFDGRMSLERVEVLKRSDKQVRVQRCWASGHGQLFTPHDFDQIFSPTPEAAVERWRANMLKMIEQSENRIVKLKAQLAADLPRGF